eukprot:COSAG05_NODE_15190_length_376_cov_0.563177_1_plen_62_part_01
MLVVADFFTKMESDYIAAKSQCPYAAISGYPFRLTLAVFSLSKSLFMKGLRLPICNRSAHES